MNLTPLGAVILGLVLFFIAPRVVGFTIKALGFGLLAFGAAVFFLNPLGLGSSQALTIVPVVAGLALIFIGKGLAEIIIKIAGAVMVVWGSIGFLQGAI